MELLGQILGSLKAAFGPTGAVIIFVLLIALAWRFREHEKWMQRYIDDLIKERDFWRGKGLELLEKQEAQSSDERS